MSYAKIFSYLRLSGIVFLGVGLPAFSQELNIESPPIKGGASNPCEIIATSPQSKKVELFYYRNSETVASLINTIPFEHKEEGCASQLPANPLASGEDVGQGGGNVIFLFGSDNYINEVRRFIATLDLPLSGINLQLWGLQVSSNNPRKLAEAMVKIRSEISKTQQLMRDTFQELQFEIADELRLENNNIAPDYQQRVRNLGFGKVFQSGRNITLLDISLIGNSVKDPSSFYAGLANEFLAKLEEEPQYKPYFEAMKNQPNSPPPFERFFRSRGLEPTCMKEILTKTGKLERCDQWKWEENTKKTNRLAKFKREATLEFAKQYSQFACYENFVCDSFSPEKLILTADLANTGLQEFSDVFQKDIEDLFVRPTLTNIQKVVRQTKGVTFAQVGRTSISTLSGVQTKINSSSTSVFQVSPPGRTLDELLERANTIQETVSPSVGVPLPTAGPIPAANLVGLVAALSEQQTVPVKVNTGTNLTFTPGVLRNSNSAELNIKLTVTDPQFSGTGDENAQPQISRVGSQEIETSIYTQSMDLFDLSTFTNQATLDGGRFRIPIIGQVWNAIFGGIPGFGDLFSFRRGNQNVFHENILLTNSFITPTPLGLVTLYDLDQYIGRERKKPDNNNSESFPIFHNPKF